MIEMLLFLIKFISRDGFYLKKIKFIIFFFSFLMLAFKIKLWYISVYTSYCEKSNLFWDILAFYD